MRALRKAFNVRPVYKRVDSCAAEFATHHRLPVFDLRGRMRGAAVRPPEDHGARRPQPHRPGGIEFDYRWVRMPRSLCARDVYETIMVNRNLKPSAPDYGLRPPVAGALTLEDVLEIVDWRSRGK